MIGTAIERCIDSWDEETQSEIHSVDEVGKARAELSALRQLVESARECYPQLYACAYGSREYRHIEPDEWDAIKNALAVIEKLNQ